MVSEKQQKEKCETNIFQRCQSFIDNPEYSFIFGKWREKFTTSLMNIYKAIKLLENDEKIENFSFTSIEECINFLTSMTVEKKLDSNFLDFIKMFIFLSHNLNDNFKQYEAVERKIQYLQRFCDNALTFSEYTSLLRTLNKRVNRNKDWTPPSFRLSGHYYDLLKEE